MKKSSLVIDYVKPRKTPVKKIEPRKKRNFSEFMDGLSGSGSSDSDSGDDASAPKGNKRLKPNNSTPVIGADGKVKKEGKKPIKPSSKAQRKADEEAKKNKTDKGPEDEHVEI